MARIITIANQKGGVGKTTTAINLASSLSHFGRRVLLVDMDPQGNCSRGVGVDISSLSRTIFDALVGEKEVTKLIKKTCIKNLEVLPANLKLASFSPSVIINNDNPNFILKKILEPLLVNYDYLLIDCPPSLGLLTMNALVAADSVLIPVQCEYFAMEAVAQILGTISQVKSLHNPNLGIEGFLLTMYDSRMKLCDEISNEVKTLFKENTFLSVIPRNISIPEASARWLPVTEYRPSSAGSLAYFSLAKEVMDHEERR